MCNKSEARPVCMLCWWVPAQGSKSGDWGIGKEGKQSRQFHSHTGHAQGGHVEPVHLRTVQREERRQSDCGSFCSLFWSSKFTPVSIKLCGRVCKNGHKNSYHSCIHPCTYPFAMWLCSNSYQEDRSLSPPLKSSFGHMTFFGRWDISKYDAEQRLEKRMCIGACPVLLLGTSVTVYITLG